ncbi:MAG: hypothetical protein QOI40_4478, partial [Alphaproteobacteria bacterium]|nr:hypothetical protein [Alphaproteobacteria bacterium]
MRDFRHLAGTVSATFLLLVAAGAAGAQTPAEFFKGKAVNLLIGLGVG